MDGSSAASPNLVRTKLYRPRLPGDLVQRTRLTDWLSRGLSRTLTLVVAPAGFGKTILVSSWLQGCERPSVWVSLDEKDNDLRTFAAYLVAAVRGVFPGSLARTQSLLAGVTLTSAAVIAGSLINDIEELDRDLILVLDDYHAIHDPAVHELLADLLQHPLQHLHLVLVTRSDPPLPLGLLRAGDHMTEIRAHDLRFTGEEISLFMANAIGVPLGTEALTVLAERTEGWIAGLRLAALTLQQTGDADTRIAEVDRRIAELDADNRYVMDYLMSEVLRLVPPGVEAFLLRTSFLDRLCGPLADAVMGPDGPVPDGKTQLQWLERQGLFTMAMDQAGNWYRYHRLFRMLLRSRLERQYGATALARLHAVAGAWFAGQGLFEEALEHMLAGGDSVSAIQLVAQHRHELLNTEQRSRLESWLQLFPAGTIARSPDLLLARAWILLLGRSDFAFVVEAANEAEALLGQMEGQPGRERQLRGEIATLRSVVMGFAGTDPAAVCRLTTMALEAMPREWYLARSEAWLHLALAQQMVGDLDTAYATLAKAQEEDVTPSGMVKGRNAGSAGFVYWMAADLPGLLDAATGLVSTYAAGGRDESLGWGRYMLACAHYQRNELDPAAQNAEAVLQKRYTSHPICVLQSAFILASVHQARGRPEQAKRMLEVAGDYLRETGSQGLLGLHQAYAAELAAVQGELDMAERWAATVGSHLALAAMAFFYAPQLTPPKVLLLLNTPASRRAAADALSRLHAYVLATHNTRFTVEVLAMQALLADAEGDERAALRTLAQSVALARRGGLLRVFIDLGPRMAHLFVRLSSSEGVHGFVAVVLAAFAPMGQAMHLPVPSREQASAEALTPRELEVLWLLAQRFSDKEIAQRLGIAEPTVARHTANIYAKLGVSSRREAVATAAAVGILPSGERRF